jgi:DNA replication and repair protein RecF
MCLHIVHLSLANFRNYARLELDLPSHMMVIQGENAQGKSNLLEAVYLLATSRSPHAGAESEIINWAAHEETPAISRIAADIRRDDRQLRLEIALMARTSAIHEVTGSLAGGQAPARAAPIQKRVRVNGATRRVADLVGQINVVAFSVHDIDLIGGEPALRRRYLDIANSQIDRHYLRQLQRYNRILWQRNRLLRRIRENQARPAELSFWDEELIQTGSYLVERRGQMIAALSELARTVHDELSSGQGRLRLVYKRSIDKGTPAGGSASDDIAQRFSQSLCAAREKELAQGMSLVGPHRDDVSFLADEVNLGTYGSRGQQRTATLSLKLAEAQFMLGRTGEHPILLMDDVLSELDSQRRIQVLRAITGYEQVLITTTDLDHFEPGFLEQAELFSVTEGQVRPLTA